MTVNVVQMENVYEEVLYSLLHVVNKTSSSNIDQAFDYLKKVYQFTNEKHEQLESNVRGRPPPSRISLPLGKKSKEVRNFGQYEHFLRTVVEHEMRVDDRWRGLLPDDLLRQFAVHLGLGKSVADTCSWSVYSTALHKRTLDFTVLLTLIKRLPKALKKGKLTEEELINMFWTATDSFTEAALSSIYNLRNISEPEQLSALLECLKELNLMSPTRPELSNLGSRIKAEVTKGTVDWYNQLIKGEIEETCNENRLKKKIRICQALMTDLETVLFVYEPIFQRVWKMSVFSLIYLYYDTQLAELVKPAIDDISQTLKSNKTSKEQIISMAVEASGENDKQDTDAIAPQLSMGTALFELYLCLQQFHKLSNSLPQTEKDVVKLSLFYTWFKVAVDRWLDIALYKALNRISKAILLDDLQPVDSVVKHSSSAVDTVTVFYQIKASWDQLAWPSEEESLLLYVNTVIENVKLSSWFYVEEIHLKLKKIHSGSPILISLELCSAINNILHVQQSIKPLAEKLGYIELNSNKNNTSNTNLLTDIAVKDINAKLDEIYIDIARLFEFEVARMINKVKETNSGVCQTEELNSYICNQLHTLNSNLCRDLFLHIHGIIFHHVLLNFLKVVETEVQKKRQPDRFRQWKELLDMLDNSFRNPDADPDKINEDETLTKLRWLLELHQMETSQLIHFHRLERMKQADGQNVDFGSLAVRVIFIKDVLHIEILNARDLKRMDPSGSTKKKVKCKIKKKSIDPYVKVQLLPTHHFPEVTIQKSKVHKNTLFPLFEESFTFPVPKLQQASEECRILFIVKDRNILRTNQLMGESFFSFHQIAHSDNAVNMNELEQIILPLTKPPVFDSEYLNVLKERTWDKTARDFAKKEKKRVKCN